MKIGFNLLLWTTFLSEKDFHIIDKLKNEAKYSHI